MDALLQWWGPKQGETSGSPSNMVTAQWYGCPAKTPTPFTVAENATWNWTTKSAPLLSPEIEMPEGAMSSAGSGAGAARALALALALAAPALPASSQQVDRPMAAIAWSGGLA